MQKNPHTIPPKIENRQEPDKPSSTRRGGIPPVAAEASHLIDIRNEITVCNAMVKKSLAG